VREVPERHPDEAGHLAEVDVCAIIDVGVVGPDVEGVPG